MRSIQEIVELRDYLKNNYYNQLHANFDILSDYYNQNMALGKMPTMATIYKPPTAREQVNSAVHQVMQLEHLVRVPYWNANQKDKEIAGRLIKFGEAFLLWLGKHYKVNLRAAFLKNMFLYGTGVLKGPLYIPREQNGDDAKYWQSKLERTFPLEFRNIHPKNIFPEPDDPVPSVIESYGRTVASVKKIWPEWDEGFKKPTDKITWWEYWDAEQKQYFVGDDPILDDDSMENPYGFIPYEFGDSGYGLDSPDAKPEEAICGLIAPALSTYVAEARMKSAILFGLEQGIYTRPILEKPPDPTNFKWADTLGDWSIVPADLGLKKYGPEQVVPDAYRWLSMVENDQQTVLPKNLAGMAQKGYTSGYGQAMGVGQAKTKLKGPQTSWENAISRVLDKILYMVKEVIDEPIGIVGNFPEGLSVTTIRPNEIDPDNIHYYVSLDAESPEEKDRRQLLGMRLLSINGPLGVGGLSYDTICREYFDKDPQEEIDNMLVQSAMNSPIIQAALAAQALSDAGMKELLGAIKNGELGQFQHGPSGTQDRAFSDYQRTKMRLQPGTQTMASEPEMEGAPNEVQNVSPY